MKRETVKFNCFSPPVMLATLTIESALTLYTLWRYKLTTLTRLSVVMLVGLAVFQLAEYQVCTGSAAGEAWSRVGFIAITALPPLGVHIMHVLAGKRAGKLVGSVYAVMAGFMAYFVLYPGTFQGHQCMGNYVIFQLSNKVGGLYGIYYYALLAIGIGLGVYWANQLIKHKTDIDKLKSVRALMLGYLVFLVPTAVTNSLSPSTLNGIPSIMCGFAVMFALILGFYILPRSAEQKSFTNGSVDGHRPRLS